jgi:hypothetical protein
MKREIRSGAVSGVAGVGAILDVGKESFIVPGIDLWSQGQLRVIDLKRLSGRLRKTLKAPSDSSPTLMVRRFPRAMFCEKCRKITHWQVDMEKPDAEPTCPESQCGGSLVSMGFVSACEHGHLDDVDWRYWAHSGPQGNRDCRIPNAVSFRMVSGAVSAGLSSVMVICQCGSYRTLEELANKALIKEVFRSCSGRHPWRFGARDDCPADVVVLQRGATNLHYPSTVSALDIPDEAVENRTAEFASQVKAHPRFERLVALLRSADGGASELVEVLGDAVSSAVGCEVEVVLEIARAEADGRPIEGVGDAGLGTVDQAQLLNEEWKTLKAALQSGQIIGPTFAAVAEELSPLAPQWMNRLIKGVLLIRRLREVRAFFGYHRVTPGDPDRMVKPDVGAPQNWLPASETYGEGVLLELDTELLERWRAGIPDSEGAALAELETKRLADNFWFLPKVDPVFIALHTLSHLLLRRITFECGYSSSSLRERLYFNADLGYAGIMIYTADGDSEGSLGGLVRQGRRDRLAQTIVEAMDQGGWCSSDPVCSETAGQGLGGFNHAACHACSLVSETSCTHANTLLDRRMLFDEAWGLLAVAERK